MIPHFIGDEKYKSVFKDVIIEGAKKLRPEKGRKPPDSHKAELTFLYFRTLILRMQSFLCISGLNVIPRKK